MIEWLSNYSDLTNIIITLFNLFAAIITAFLFLGILGLTWWYSKSTRDIAKKTSESVEITKEKEKIDRALDFSERFYRKSLVESISESVHYLDERALKRSESLNVRGREIWWRIDRILSFFDLLSFLIIEEKVNYYMIRKEFSDDFIYFFHNRIRKRKF